MLYRGKPLQITADQVADVRKAIGETQLEFAWRFARSRFSIIRWEADGVKFKYKSRRWYNWQSAVTEAMRQHKVKTEGADDDRSKKLRALRIFSQERW